MRIGHLHDLLLGGLQNQDSCYMRTFSIALRVVLTQLPAEKLNIKRSSSCLNSQHSGIKTRHTNEW